MGIFRSLRDLYKAVRGLEEVQTFLEAGVDPPVDLGFEESRGVAHCREPLEEIAEPVFYRNSDGVYDCFFNYRIYMSGLLIADCDFESDVQYQLRIDSKTGRVLREFFDRAFNKSLGDWLRYDVDDSDLADEEWGEIKGSLREKVLNDPLVLELLKEKYF